MASSVEAPISTLYDDRVNMFLPNNFQGAPKRHRKKIARCCALILSEWHVVCVRVHFQQARPMGPRALGGPRGPSLERVRSAHRAAAFVFLDRPMGARGPRGGPCSRFACKRYCYVFKCCLVGWAFHAKQSCGLARSTASGCDVCVSSVCRL